MVKEKPETINLIKNLSSLVLKNKPAFVSIIVNKYRMEGIMPESAYVGEYQSVYLLPISGTSSHLSIMESIESIKSEMFIREIGKYHFISIEDFPSKIFDDYFEIEFRDSIDVFLLEKYW